MQNEVTTPRHHQPTSPNHHRTPGPPPDPRIQLDPEKTVDLFLENDQIHVMSNRKKHPKIEIHSKKTEFSKKSTADPNRPPKSETVNDFKKQSDVNNS